MAKRTLIKGGTVISVDPAVGDFDPGDVLIEERSHPAKSNNIDAGDAEVIDATDRIVLPGLIDTHRHTWQALFRNIGSDWTLAHYFTVSPEAESGTPAPRGHLRGQPDRNARGARRRHHDAARLVPQPQHPRALGRRHQGAAGDRLARDFGHGCGFAHWAPVSSLPHDEDIRRVASQYFSSDDQLVTLAMAPRGNQFATLDVTESDYRLADELNIRITATRAMASGARAGRCAARRARPAGAEPERRALQLAGRRRVEDDG